VAGYYFKKFVTTATRVSPPTSATKSAQSGHPSCAREPAINFRIRGQGAARGLFGGRVDRLGRARRHIGDAHSGARAEHERHHDAHAVHCHV
jgi:hypothetical protein